MKILLLGKDGMVGVALTKLLHHESIECELHGRSTANFEDSQACAKLVEESSANVIVNAAAYTAVDKAEEEFPLAVQVNAKAVSAIAKAAERTGKSLIHISTDYVFSAYGDKPLQPTDPIDPVNAYGQSKWLGEKEVRDSGVRHAILRTSWVFSAHGNNFVKTMLRLAASRDELSIVADQIGGPTSAASIAKAMLTIANALHQQKHVGGIYHFSGAPDVSWAEFAREIFSLSGQRIAVSDIKTVDYPTPAKRPHNSRLDCQTTKAEFNIDRPDWKSDLQEVLEELEAK